MRKVLFIFGTRPEAIKLAPLVRAMLESPELTPVVCLTAQHREMLDQVMDLFGLPANHDLNIMRANQTLAGLTSRLIENLDQVVREEAPSVVVVQGDTTSTFCGALAAFYRAATTRGPKSDEPDTLYPNWAILLRSYVDARSWFLVLATVAACVAGLFITNSYHSTHLDRISTTWPSVDGKIFPHMLDALAV